MRQVDAYSISKRQSMLSEYSIISAHEAARCSLLFEDARKNNKRSDILELIKECSTNRANGKIYGRALAEMVSDNTSLTNQFLSTISLYESGTLNDILTSRKISDTIRNKVVEQLGINEASDTVYSNHKAITKEYDMSEFITEMYCQDVNIITDKICEVVDRFSIPVYGKVQSAISEAYYLFSKFNIGFKEKELVDYISEYFLLSNGPYKDDLQIRAISESLENTYLKYVISEGLFDKGDESPSRVESICRDFTEKGDTSTAAISAFHNDIMNSPMSEVAEDFNKYLNTLMRILLMPEEDDASDYILRDVVTKIYMDTKSRDRDELKTLITRLDWHISKVDNYINDYEPDKDVKERLTKYRGNLQDVRELLDNDMSALSSSYNEACELLEKDVEPMTLQEYKIFKFDNLITRTYKLDKYIQNKVEPSRQKIFKYIKDKNQEIFGEDASVYEFLTPDGNIDYCVESYAYDESKVDYNELNSFLTKIVMEANESILNDSDLICYYEITTDLIEFHVREYANILLDEDERTFVENYLSREDESRMLTIFSTGALIDENYDYCRETVKYFTNPDMDNSIRVDKFKELLEVSASIGIPKDIIRENYSQIEYNLEGYNRSMFRYFASSMVENYTPVESNNDLTSILEGLNYTQYILELVHDPYTAVNTKNLEKFGYHGEDEGKRGDDDEDDRPVKKPQQNITPHKAEPEPEEADDDYKDVEKQGPLANMTPTNIKLAGKAAGQKVRNAEAKVDRAFRMSDVIFNHFIKSCKQALISDRREAIIKGSVIPSFSKCIKISLVLAGLGLATGGVAVPVLTALGGLIASKKLTERERSLLLDDIEVEIQVIDKELQIADSNNQINKYRALMKMKKDLQRQYQRIKTGIRMGKDFIPSKTSIDAE